jgi:hypothetical protein
LKGLPIDQTTLDQLRRTAEWAQQIGSTLGFSSTPERRRRGKPQGSAKFRNVELLVEGLHHAARSFGGRLTLDKTLHKGSLLVALDRVRQLMLADRRYKWLAELLPPPGHHPVSTYQRRVIRSNRFSIEPFFFFLDRTV